MQYTWENLVDAILYSIPELKKSIEDLKIDAENISRNLSQKDIEFLGESGITDYSKVSLHNIDYYFIFEVSLIDLLKKLYLTDVSRLKEILLWLEGVSKSSDSSVINLIKVGFCDSVVNQPVDFLEVVYPFFGKILKTFCIESLEDFNLPEEITSLIQR